MKDLIIRITGSVQENNIEEWKRSAIAEIRKMDKQLVTDEDFADGEVAVKLCKEAENKIVIAKEKAVNENADVAKMFSVLDEVFAEFRDTRLKLEKQIKTEKEAIKNRIISSGMDEISASVKDSPVFGLFAINSKAVADAVKGKKTVKSMEESVNGVVLFEKERLLSFVENYSANISVIESAESEHIGLFPDKKQLATKTSGEVAAIISRRIAEKELAEMKAAERETKQPEVNPPPQQVQPQKKPAAQEETFSINLDVWFTVTARTKQSVMAQIRSIPGFIEMQEKEAETPF